MKASARQIIDRDAADRRFQIPQYALGQQELWTPKLVKEALVTAFITCERTTGRVGPRGFKSSWTQFAADCNDIWEQRRTGSNEIGRHRDRSQVTAKAIARSEAILEGGRLATDRETVAWLSLVAGDLRLKLDVWLLYEMGKETGRTTRTQAELCVLFGWSLATFKRHVERAAGVIAVRLNGDGVAVW